MGIRVASDRERNRKGDGKGNGKGKEGRKERHRRVDGASQQPEAQQFGRSEVIAATRVSRSTLGIGEDTG